MWTTPLFLPGWSCSSAAAYDDEPVIAQYSEVKHIALHTAEGNYSVLKREEREVS